CHPNPAIAGEESDLAGPDRGFTSLRLGVKLSGPLNLYQLQGESPGACALASSGLAPSWPANSFGVLWRSVKPSSRYSRYTRFLPTFQPSRFSSTWIFR